MQRGLGIPGDGISDELVENAVAIEEGGDPHLAASDSQ
jgi:hypothetical protein